ncbi:hypothetical protein GOBAR_DD17784 [Gossypium barbadense]|nr:hypothetical protein GOBAR_DD17784 [Gossypium barbadense]
MEEEGGTGNRQEGSPTTSTESSHLERGRSKVKHEKTRAPEIASTYYKPDGEGVKELRQTTAAGKGFTNQREGNNKRRTSNALTPAAVVVVRDKKGRGLWRAKMRPFADCQRLSTKRRSS